MLVSYPCLHCRCEQALLIGGGAEITGHSASRCRRTQGRKKRESSNQQCKWDRCFRHL